MPGAGDRPRRPVPPLRAQGPGRGRVLLPTLALLFVLALLFGLFTGFYTELLWFQSVRYSSVFWRELATKAGLFVVFGAFMAAAVAANIVVAWRTRPAYRGMSPEQQSLERYRASIEPFRRVLAIGLPVAIGLLAGSSAASEWRTFLVWRNGADFGVRDPQFKMDVGFFAFDYPWWRLVLSYLFSAVIVSLLAAAVTHYLYGGLRLQTAGDKTSQAARVHISVLAGLFVLLKAAAYWLDRYGLAIKDGSRLVGLQYTDVNAVLPAKTILAVVAVITGLLFFVNIASRGWMLPSIGLGLLVLCAVLIGGIYPAVIQQFRVKPSEADREAPYITLNIESTRRAYGLDKVQTQEYQAQVGTRAGALAGDAATVRNVRLVDPAVVPDTFTQLQQVRGFYDFADSLDVDRYVINGEQRDTVVAVRELDLTGLPAQQQNWINNHTVYTHGYGFVAALGNTRDQQGRPTFVSANIPPTGALGKFESRVYFGEKSPDYSVVGAAAGGVPREFDFPTDTGGTGQQNTTYDGDGGVPMGSLFRRALYAMKFQESNLLLSNRINADSKILYDRVPRERVRKIAPWLELDGDPYPAIVDGRLLWIIDGYTTSNAYPYSDRQVLGDVTQDSLSAQTSAIAAQPRARVNYIRNSVKATVDAYDGTVTLYAWDETDPVLATWRDAFPGTVQPRSEISEDLMAHLRYPEDFFKVQRELYSRYHVSDPQAFYSGSDFWRVPRDPRPDVGSEDQPPYYLTLQMPGQERPSFSLTSTFVPTGNRENLTAFMAVNASPGPDYGTIRVLQVPRSLNVKGPRQVQNDFSSSDKVAQDINLLRRGDSDVVFGNLLTLPVGDGFLYVEPVYVKARSGTSFPLLRKVLTSFGENVAFEDTLQAGLNTLFQGRSGVTTGEGPLVAPPPTPTASPSPSPSPSPGATGRPSPRPSPAPGGSELAAALADAQRALADAQAALRAGDFAEYGAAQQRLQEAIERAVAAERRAGGSGATARAAAVATRSPAPAPSG